MHPNLPTLLGAAALVAINTAGLAAPQTEPEEELVRASVHAEHHGIQPGQTVWIGLQLDMADEWYTYWPGQNDTGFGTKITSSGPTGVTFGDPKWPLPQRHISSGFILDHVYRGSVLVLVPVTLAEDAPPGEHLDLDFHLDWLVCREVCIPGEDTVVISLPVINAEPELNSSVADRFAATRARIPEPLPENERVVTVEWNNNNVVLRARGAHRMTFYPDSKSSHVENLHKQGDVDGDMMRLTVHGENPTLSGVVEIFSRDNRSRIYRISFDSRNPT
ncbi:MAG: hypothetical protein LAT64_07715 [Phycisphaerales bacterium]|nr:hypothetical protein [Planctomycetota bacterium]MCH8508642.1 hypothetical protein [Phycisphaerales bacterium]